MAPKPRPADGRHVVIDGEWVGSIARMYGIPDWQKLWDHPLNKTLKELRVDPFVLGEGDVLHLQVVKPKTVTLRTGKSHMFQLKGMTEDVLTVRLLGDDAKPLQNTVYTLELECSDTPVPFKQQNQKTDGDGVLTETIPDVATRAILHIPDVGRTMYLNIGKLTPIDLHDEHKKMRGAQERLSALGFSPGPIDGIDGPMTHRAVVQFQRYCHDHAGKDRPEVIDAGAADGVVGPKTKAALIKMYGA